MTFPTWLESAPQRVLTLLSLTAILALGGWVWTIAGESAEQKAAVAVAAVEAQAATAQLADLRSELRRINAKLDRLIEAVAYLTAERASTHKDRPPRVDTDREKTR